MAYGETQQTCHSDYGIHNQQLEARLIARPFLKAPLEHPAESRRGNADQRHKAVAHGLLPEHAVHKQAEDGTVGIGSQCVHRGNGILVAYVIESYDDDAHERRHHQMHTLAGACQRGFVLGFVRAKKVDGKRGRKRSQRRTCGGIGGSD